MLAQNQTENFGSGLDLEDLETKTKGLCLLNFILNETVNTSNPKYSSILYQKATILGMFPN